MSGNKKSPEMIISYYEEKVIIKRLTDNDMVVMVLDYDDFEELAHLIRQSPYGK